MTSKADTKARFPVLISGSIDLQSVCPVIEYRSFETPYGIAEGYLSEECFVILRHGKENKTAPHRINHQANIAAAKQLGPFIFALGSVGSLDEEVGPGSIAIPDDIFAPYLIETISNDAERIHVVPEFDSKLRRHLISDLSFAGIGFTDGGTYAQTRGPRFESKSEVLWLSDYAHFVGMTCASELTIACELQVPYALLVSVDNWGNGLGPKSLTMDEYLLGVEANHEMVCSTLGFLLPSLKRLAEAGFGSHS